MPIFVTELGIIIDVSPLQSLNVLLPMLLTEYVIDSYITDDGIISEPVG